MKIMQRENFSQRRKRIRLIALILTQFSTKVKQLESAVDTSYHAAYFCNDI